MILFQVSYWPCTLHHRLGLPMEPTAMRACSVSGFIRGGLPSSLLDRSLPELACPGSAEIVSSGITADASVAVIVGVLWPSTPFLGADGSTDGSGGSAAGRVGAVVKSGGSREDGNFDFFGEGFESQRIVFKLVLMGVLTGSGRGVIVDMSVTVRAGAVTVMVAGGWTGGSGSGAGGSGSAGASTGCGSSNG